MFDPSFEGSSRSGAKAKPLEAPLGPFGHQLCDLFSLDKSALLQKPKSLASTEVPETELYRLDEAVSTTPPEERIPGRRCVAQERSFPKEAPLGRFRSLSSAGRQPR